MAHGHNRRFIRQLLANPFHTGAVLPSSAELARRMVEYADPGEKSVIVELGPGTGVFTRRIRAMLQPKQKFFAVEISEDFAKELRKDMPGLHVHIGCASKLADYCRAEGVDHVDRVISGLPWANFPDDLQNRILDAMVAMLSPGGVFVTFAYLQGLVMPSGRKFKANVRKRFSKVDVSSVVWKNVPPAVMYRCIK